MNRMNRIIRLTDMDDGGLEFRWPDGPEDAWGAVICPHMRPAPVTVILVPGASAYSQATAESSPDYIECDQGCPYLKRSDIGGVFCTFEKPEGRLLGILEEKE